MLRLVLLLTLVSGCGDTAVQADAGPECSTVTRYRGAEVTCDEGAGLCVNHAGGPSECLPRCATTGAVCQGNDHWYTLLLDDNSNACYCAPI